MNEVILKALKESIEHWQNNIDAETWEHAHIYSGYCPLCKVCLEQTRQLA